MLLSQCDCVNIYSKLIENSQLLECRILDELTPLPEEYIKKIIPKIQLFVAPNIDNFRRRSFFTNFYKNQKVNI